MQVDDIYYTLNVLAQYRKVVNDKRAIAMLLYDARLKRSLMYCTKTLHKCLKTLTIVPTENKADAWIYGTICVLTREYRPTPEK